MRKYKWLTILGIASLLLVIWYFLIATCLTDTSEVIYHYTCGVALLMVFPADCLNELFEDNWFFQISRLIILIHSIWIYHFVVCIKAKINTTKK